MVKGVDMMSDRTRRNLRVVFVLAALIFWALAFSGCEDDGDRTTINEADINAGSNGVLLIDGNTGTVSVDQTTSTDGDDPSIIITGNTGRVYVVTRPYIPEPEPETP
jgi:hypothetical protein